MEEIGNLLGKGFSIWRNNLNLCVPFLLSSFLSLLVAVPFIMVFAATITPSTDMNFTSVQQMEAILAKNEEIISSMNSEMVIEIALLSILMFALLFMLRAFFTAGAIGMARQAQEKGKTDNQAMWNAGRKHLWKMFLADISTNLIMAMGLVFLLPALASQPFSSNPESLSMMLILAGLILLMIYALAWSLMLTMVPYALVIDDLGAIGAISASIDFFRYNKFDVLVLWLIVLAISIGVQMIYGSFFPADAIGRQIPSIGFALVDVLVLTPLYNLWWTRLYMNRKGILKVEEVKDAW